MKVINTASDSTDPQLFVRNRSTETVVSLAMIAMLLQRPWVTDSPGARQNWPSGARLVAIEKRSLRLVPLSIAASH